MIDPDVVWLFQDFWHIAAYIQNSPNMRGLCVYYPVDSPNMKSNWAVYLSSAVEVATYTQFAAEETSKSVQYSLERLMHTAKEQGKDEVDKIKLATKDGEGILVSAARLKELTNSDNINIITHGVDLDTFHQIDKKEARAKVGFEDDWFIVANFNRNQPRKRIDLTFEAFAKFAKDKPNARLLLHDPLFSKQDGWDLLQMAAEVFHISDKILLSGKNQLGNNLSEKELNNLYSTVDVMLNTCGGEGFGLISAESAICGAAQIVPNWSATAEIWKDSAILIDPITYNYQPVINTKHCVVDTDQIAVELNKLYQDPKYLQEVSKKCQDNMLCGDYNWDIITKQFEDMFNRAAEKKYIYDDTPIKVE